MFFVRGHDLRTVAGHFLGLFRSREVVDDSSRHALHDTFEAPFKTALIRRLSVAWQLGWVYLWPRFAAKALLLPRYGSESGFDGLNGRRLYRKLYGKQRGFA